MNMFIEYKDKYIIYVNMVMGFVSNFIFLYMYIYSCSFYIIFNIGRNLFAINY